MADSSISKIKDAEEKMDGSNYSLNSSPNMYSNWVKYCGKSTHVIAEMNWLSTFSVVCS
jgi:hypothetical protein